MRKQIKTRDTLLVIYIVSTHHTGLTLRDYGGAKTCIRQSWRCFRAALTVAEVSGFPAVVSPGSPNCTPPGKTNSSTWNASQWIHETPRIPPTPRQNSPIRTMVRELLLTGAVVKRGTQAHSDKYRLNYRKQNVSGRLYLENISSLTNKTRLVWKFRFFKHLQYQII